MEQLPTELVIKVFENLTFSELYNVSNINEKFKNISFMIMKKTPLKQRIGESIIISKEHELTENYKETLFGEYKDIFDAINNGSSLIEKISRTEAYIRHLQKLGYHVD